MIVKNVTMQDVPNNPPKWLTTSSTPLMVWQHYEHHIGWTKLKRMVALDMDLVGVTSTFPLRLWNLEWQSSWFKISNRWKQFMIRCHGGCGYIRVTRIVMGCSCLFWHKIYIRGCLPWRTLRFDDKWIPLPDFATCHL